MRIALDAPSWASVVLKIERMSRCSNPMWGTGGMAYCSSAATDHRGTRLIPASHPFHSSSIMWHSLVLAICPCAFVSGKRCFPQCPSAWPVSSYLNPPYLHSSFTMLLHNADTLRIDNQNGGRGCRASKLIPLFRPGV